MNENSYNNVKDKLMVSVRYLNKRKIHKDEITCLGFTENGGEILSTGKDGRLKQTDQKTLENKKSFLISDRVISSFVSINQHMLILGGWDHKLHVFNMNYGSVVTSFEAHDNAVSNQLYLPKKV